MNQLTVSTQVEVQAGKRRRRDLVRVGAQSEALTRTRSHKEMNDAYLPSLTVFPTSTWGITSRSGESHSSGSFYLASPSVVQPASFFFTSPVRPDHPTRRGCRTPRRNIQLRRQLRRRRAHRARTRATQRPRWTTGCTPGKARTDDRLDDEGRPCAIEAGKGRSVIGFRSRAVKVLTLSPTPCPFVKLDVVPSSRIGSLVPRR